MSDGEQEVDVDLTLRQMFQSLEDRPVPGAILSVVDQLDQGEPEPAPPRANRG